MNRNQQNAVSRYRGMVDTELQIIYRETSHIEDWRNFMTQD